ncbi:hypothetical protein Q8A73_020028 [Channa argus]|nr:hypothetical protein Q8A73_020028 [Channa argus]
MSGRAKAETVAFTSQRVSSTDWAAARQRHRTGGKQERRNATGRGFIDAFNKRDEGYRIHTWSNRSYNLNTRYNDSEAASATRCRKNKRDALTAYEYTESDYSRFPNLGAVKMRRRFFLSASQERLFSSSHRCLINYRSIALRRRSSGIVVIR